MKKLFNLAAFGFIAKVIFVIFFAFTFKQLSFGQSCTNLVVNGDFSSGNTGFTNNYTYFAPGGATAIGRYSVVNSTHVPTANPQWACTGHTTASSTDQFLMCDGASQAGNIAWKQTVSGNGQGCYKFCFWVNNLVIPTRDYADPIIQAKINGVNVGTAVTVPENPDTWVQVCVTWNGALPANLEILSTQPAVVGNDFAIDDISFSKCCDVSLNLQAAAGCSLNYNVSATACGAGPFTYQWCNGSTGPSYNASVPCGNNTFCVTMTDSQQCTATATQTINAKDNVPPVALCKPGIGVLLNANCQYVVDAAFVNNGSTDNCGIQSVTVSPTLLTGCGNTTVTLTVKDLCNNTSTCTMGIQTIETTPPTISCPANKTINCDDSILPANTGSPTSQDACGIKSTTYVNGISEKLICGSRFVRTWTVEDNCGNKSTCTQVITITDTKPPVIICPPNKTLTCGTQNVPGITGIATATDNCTATTDISITSSDFVTGIADCDQTIIRTWTAKDRCGNTSSCTQIISIIDNVKPVISNCPPNITVTGTIDANGNCVSNASFIKPTATDNCDPSVTISNNAPAIFPAGNTTVIWTATDDCKNTATCSTIVTVNCQFCECGAGFTNLFYRPTQGGASQPKNCGDTLIAPCKPAFNPTITGTFACIGNCPNAPITWQLTSPSGVVTTGTVPNAATFSVSVLGASLSTTGVYQLTLTGQCGNKICPPCRFFIKVTCDNCACGSFTNILYRPSQGAQSMPKVCGDTLVAPCKPTFNPTITGTFACVGTCPTVAPIKWELISPSGIITMGTVPNAATFSVSVLGTSLSETGVYKLTLTSQCGNIICPPCKFYIKVTCDNCACGSFTNILYRPSQGAQSMPKVCGDTLVAPCKPTFNPTITGTFACVGTCPTVAPIKWELKSPSGIITMGTVPNAATFSVSILGTSLSETGVYQLTLTSQCGNIICPPCKFYIKVNCNNCECGSFTNLTYQVSPAIPPVSKKCGDTLAIACKPNFSPTFGGLFACVGNCPTVAPVKWELFNSSNISVASGTASSAFSVSFPGSLLATSGLYQLVLTGQCGTTVCPPCKLYIKVNCPGTDCGYIRNSDFNSGTPTGDEGINSATNWSGIWNNTGCSTGDFYPNPAALPWLLTNPLPVTQGNYGSFWVNKTAATTNIVWREGIMNNLNATINKNSGCYEVEFKVACLYPAYKVPFLKVYGVDKIAPPAANCPTYLGLNTALFSASGGTVKDLGTYALTSQCNNNYQTVKVVFNTSTWGTDINHIFFTRSDDTEGHAYVALDDVCVRKVNCGTCECGTVNNAVVYHVANTPVAIACNNATRLKIPCRKVGPNFFIHGDFPCLGGNCGQNNIQWELTRPSGSPVTGTLPLWGNHFDLTLPWSNFATAGNYSIKVTRFCGDKPCVCVFNFVVEACPCTCDALKSEVYQGFNVSSIIAGCKRKLKPIALCPGDAVTWNVSRLTGGTWTTTLSSTGANALVVTFPGTGWYNVCMIVSRNDVFGNKCPKKYEYCKKIYVKCFVFGDIITDSYNSSCIDNVILNGNFTDTSNVVGELGGGGIIGHWAIFKNQGSDGTVMVEDSTGAFDAGSATIIGRKNNYAGIVQKVNLSKNKLAHVVFEYYNWQNGNTPAGTTIDILLVPNATNDLGGQLLHRVNVKNDTSSAWKRVLFTVGGNINFDNKHFVCCVQNAETDKIFSVISVDNFELCSLEKTASKEETPEKVEFKVFPNPNTGDFNVELPFDATEKMKLRVTDLTGRVLTEKQPTIGSASQYMELSNLANGLYFIQVVQEGRVIGVERFVKQ